MPATARIKIDAAAAAPAGYAAPARASVDVLKILGAGTGADQIDKVYSATRQISGSGNEDLDLTTLTDAAGAALALAEVVLLYISNPATNGGDFRIQPGASNGWTALQSGSTDHVTIKPGTSLCLICTPAAAYAVAGGSKTLNVANQSGSAQSYEILVLGRSA